MLKRGGGGVRMHTHTHTIGPPPLLEFLALFTLGLCLSHQGKIIWLHVPVGRLGRFELANRLCAFDLYCMISEDAIGFNCLPT